MVIMSGNGNHNVEDGRFLPSILTIEMVMAIVDGDGTWSRILNPQYCYRHPQSLRERERESESRERDIERERKRERERERERKHHFY